MKANELRIGNMIKHKPADSKFVIVKGVHHPLYFETPTGLLDSDVFQNFEPIPLTEERLLKFGFENGDYDFEKGYIKFNRKESDYGCEYKKSNWWIVPNGDDDHYRIPIKLGYVHQLQNLYFALTGEELTVK